MRLLVNKKIRLLFNKVLVFTLIFIVLSVTFIGLKLKNAAIYIFVCSLFMSILIVISGYKYFREQNKVMEDAVAQIRDYISGNQNARIDCNYEGELYTLFNEINSLVSILNAQAKNEEKSKIFLKDTISNISHQLKTPLAALNIYNGIIQEEANSLPTIKEFTVLSEQELDRVEVLVQNLLKMAKFDAGTIIIEKDIENVSEIMECIERHFSYRAKEEGKKICLSGRENVTLLCDRNWLIEAISNIVQNAFDHTQKGDIIHIEWKKFASIVQITIKDNGSGIHPEDLYYIFKRFYRSRFSKDTQGIGIGLPLAKSIIEAHKGTIKVSSELGVGTIFTINFLITTKL